ncbi:hypothetical protein [Halobacillus faecis]|uniref:Uncharacterized protein n=1 Tax=Halobacillus faecis TaxID=360184 RepID=A0A511WX33_9BACI|nr:hypothetical protein [Halobacillus faecis]GEN55507.1 hypothetical protein HFA01_37690 [Halobacillus faecis]
MTVHNKKQSIGYMLKACLDSKVEGKMIIDIALQGLETVKSDKNYNETTSENLIKICDVLGIDETETNLKRALWWAFDDRTIEEAEEIYVGFEHVFPVLKQ